MFERYTEDARRTLFFSRYEASQHGQASIEAEHILLGLIRDRVGVVSRILAHANASPGDIRAAVEKRLVFHDKLSTSVEIPFSSETMIVLQFAALEADALNHKHIGPEHLLIGLLREDKSGAASVLMAHGITLREARQFAVEPVKDVSPPVAANAVDLDAALAQIRRIERMLKKMRTEVDTLKRRLEG